MADSKYIGKIQHSGVQKVTAPDQGGTKKGTAKVVKGTDLRTGKSGK
jgi:hypothetical protein